MGCTGAPRKCATIAYMKDRVWVIHMKRLRFEAELLQSVKEGIVAIAWKQINLCKLLDREAITKALRDLGTVREKAIPVYASMLNKFAREMGKGELIVLPVSGSDVVKIGRVDDDDVQRDEELDEEYIHVRHVQWLKDVRREDYSQIAQYSMGTFRTFTLGSDQVYKETVQLLEGKKMVKKKDEEEPEVDVTEFAINLGEVLAERLDAFIDERLDEHVGHQYAHIVAALLRAMGYVTEVAPPGPDHKRDIMAYPDELHLRDPMVRVEVKSARDAVGEDDVRALNGALRGSERGLFVARGGYTKPARLFARDLPHLALLDGEDIVRLLLKYYDKLDQETQSLIPLQQVWIPRGLNVSGHEELWRGSVPLVE